MRPYNLHLPVVGDRASTVGNLRFNFDTMPGGQATDSFIMNSLSLGVGERFEIGIIPWVYAFDQQSVMEHGITAKYNFYKSQDVQWSVGLSQIKIGMTAKENSIIDGAGFKSEMRMSQIWNYSFLAFNYTPHERSFNIGLTLKYSSIDYLSILNGYSVYELDGINYNTPINLVSSTSSYQSSFSVDSNFQVDGQHWIGAALGSGSLSSRLNIADGVDEEVGIDSKIRYLTGISYINRGKFGYFEDVRVSAIYFEGSGFNFGISSIF